MEQRINVFEKGERAITTMFAFSTYLAKSSIERKLIDLINFRVSQINGCAYCLDMVLFGLPVDKNMDVARLVD